ncbi:MAG: hypothetical protein K1000chlam1_01673 [Candidatus Anoxychlamydiales bacterium]|nr:hypothetical protein [Candidatus Anoxychlamydiales bacterium]
MAQYKTHSAFNIFLALPLFLWGMVYFFNPTYNLIGIFTGCFIYGTLFMNPDLDLANKIKLVSIRGLLTLPFRSYSMIFRHRGISHSFFLGTLTRVAWLSGFFYAILFILDKPFLHKNELISIVKSDYFLYGFFGIFLADFCHLILDFKSKKSTSR